MSDAAELKKHVKQLQNSSNNEVCRWTVACRLRARLTPARPGTCGYPKDSQKRLSGQRTTPKGRYFMCESCPWAYVLFVGEQGGSRRGQTACT